MRTPTLLLTAALIVTALTSQARIIRVNRTATYATTCTTCFYGTNALSQAVSAAISGDTIHLEPSDFSYGDVDINKKLVIIGAGYFHGASPNNIGLQANQQVSTVNRINLLTNSDSTVIMGLRFAEYGGGLFFYTTSHIRIIRNFFDSYGISFQSGNTAANITIAENYINGGINHEYGSQTLTNLVIRNNIMSGTIGLNATDDVVTNLTVTNNTFTNTGNHGLKNAQVTYNVFAAGNISGTNNEIHHNISATALSNADPLQNPVVPMGNVYNLSVGTHDSKYDILSSSPYNETGTQARGAFSGISPYRLSGIPNIPTIYSLQSTLNTTPGGTVNVTLSTRSNP